MNGVLPDDVRVGLDRLNDIALALERIADVLEKQQASAAEALRAEHARLRAEAERAERTFSVLDNLAIRARMTDWERQRHAAAEECMGRAHAELLAFESAHPELTAQVRP